MKKVFALVMAAVMVVAMFAGCGSSAPAADAKVIKIGMTGPLTGDAAVYGIAVKGGIEIAVEEINPAAGDGLKLEFQAQDDEADGEKAVSAYNVLKDWGMQVFIGTVTSGACNAVAPETVNDKMFLLTPSASAMEVATAGDTTYQMCFTDPNQGASAAEVMAKNWADAKIAVIYDSSDDYSSGLYDGFMKKAKELNLNVVLETSFTKDTKSDLSTQVTQCKDSGAELVFMPFYYQEASQVLNIANKMGYTPKYFGCDGMDGILTLENFDKSLAEGLALMTPFDANAADEATKSFVSKYTAKYGETPNQFAADAYDGIMALYQACQNTGVNGDTSFDEACELLLAEFPNLAIDGLTGKLTWNETGAVTKDPTVYIIKDGAYAKVE